MHLIEEQLGQISEITESLFLSSVDSLEKADLFPEMGISLVISVMPRPPILKTNIKQFIVPIQDSENVKIRSHFESVFELIDEAVRNNTKVLIHCEKGISRSASFVIAWLMHTYHQSNRAIDYNDILEFVRKERAIVSPNRGFTRELVDYAAELNQASTCPFNPNSPPDVYLNIISFLSPLDVLMLGHTCHFFKRLTHLDSAWKERLHRVIPFEVCEYRFFTQKQIPFKIIYYSCLYLQKKSGVKNITPAMIVGFLGKSALAHSLITEDTYNKQILPDIVFGASFGFQLELIKSLKNAKHNIEAMHPETNLNIVTYATAANNLPLLIFLKDEGNLDWTIKNKQGDNLLFVAAFYNSFACFVFLLTEAKVNPLETNLANENLLFRVSQVNAIELAQYIKDNIPGLSPYHENNSSLTAYQLSVRNSKHSLEELYTHWPIETMQVASLQL